MTLKSHVVGIKFLIIFYFVLLSCSNKRARQIAGQREKYWYVIRQNQISYSSPAYAYLLKKNGACKYYIIKKSQDGQIEKQLFDYGDVLVSNKWKLINDSTINIQGWVFKVIYITDSVLKIVDRTNDTVVLRNYQ